MGSTVEDRKLLVRIPARNLSLWARGEPENVDFIGDLEEVDARFADVRNLDDPSLNAAWGFTGFFFDAMGHGFVWGVPVPDGSERVLSPEEAGEIIEHVIQWFRDGLDVTNPIVLTYYYPTHADTRAYEAKVQAAFTKPPHSICQALRGMLRRVLPGGR